MLIPIFIITYNRLAVLREMLASLEQISTPTSIVVHDTGSTYQPLLSYLAELHRNGATVYYDRPRINRADDLNSVGDTIEHWFRDHTASYYVVTDPDVALCHGCPDILDLYGQLFDAINDIEVVAPMLRIDDIPDCYPLKKKAIERHNEQFWHKTPDVLRLGGREIRYQHAPVDTTFGMYRRGFRFHRLCNGIRTYAPYWARHLDWYLDPATMTEDQRLYLSTASDVSHWSGTWLRDSMQPGFRYDDYKFPPRV